MGQRESILTCAFTADEQFSCFPSQIIQGQSDYFTGPQAEPGQQEQDRVIALPLCRLAVTAINFGRPDKRQCGTVGTAWAKSVLIAPAWRRKRKKLRRAGAGNLA